MIKMHSLQKGSYFLYFLEIHNKLAGIMHLKTTLYHILAIPENSCTEEREAEAQSTKYWLTPDKMVYSLMYKLLVFS